MTYPYYVTITQVSSGDYIADDNTQNDMSKKDSIRALGYFVVTASQFADAVKQNFSDKEV